MKKIVAAALGLAIVIALVAGGRGLAPHIPDAIAWVRRAGPWGPVAFALIYVVTTVVFIPGAWMALAAGALFGFVRGFLAVAAGAVLGSSAAFLIARYGARRWVTSRLRPGAAFDRIDRAVAARGRHIVMLLRLSPLVPYNVLNYVLGLTRVRFVDYVAGAIGMAPATVLYVYSGKVAGDLAIVAGGASVPRGAGYYVVLAAGLLATLTVTIVLTRVASRELREK